MAKLPKPQELTKIDFKPPETSWMDTPVEFRPGTYSYASKPESLEMIGFPNPRIWSPADEDWKLPENWQTIIAAIRESAAEYVVVEQDESRERTPLEAAEISRNFLRKNFCI